MNNGDRVHEALSCAGRGDTDAVASILSGGLSVDAKGNGGATMLIQAARHKRVETVHYLLQSGAAVDARNDIGWTSLNYAARYNRIDIASALLQSGAHIDTEANDFQTPLISAARYGHKKMIKFLLDSGASTEREATQTTGETAVIVATLNRHVKCLALLLDRGASTEAKDGGRTALLWAAEMWPLRGRKDIVEVVRVLLVNGGADIEAKDNSIGRTALLWAATKGHTETVELLLDRGAAEDAKECRIACMYAAANQHIELFEKLYRFCEK
jgi:ankyrin repeat protein